MLSRREKLLIHPWQVQRFENHKRKVQSAQPAIDFQTPPVYSHVTNKLKKLQGEKERLEKINKENVRLLQRLGNIMSTKRLENLWNQPRPNFLNREKFELNRPKTCKGRIELLDEMSNLTLNTPDSTMCSSKLSTDRKLLSSKIRCPTCAGRPVKRNQVIPEERIPWEPARKSWNKKLRNDKFEHHKCCLLYCK